MSVGVGFGTKNIDSSFNILTQVSITIYILDSVSSGRTAFFPYTAFHLLLHFSTVSNQIGKLKAI